MQCENVKVYLDAYLSSETPAWAGLEIDSHLEKCLSCAGLFETRQRVKNALRRAAKNDPVPSTLSDRIRERIRRSVPRVWRRRSSRALTFLQEIRDAIHGPNRMVVVIGPKAVTSDYVRAEWQYALVEDKAVAHILRLGAHNLLLSFAKTSSAFSFNNLGKPDITC